jgi:mRNA interferase MazF
MGGGCQIPAGSSFRPTSFLTSPYSWALNLGLQIRANGWKAQWEDHPFFVSLDPTPHNGLDKKSVVDCFQIRAISHERFLDKAGSVSDLELDRIKRSVALILDLILSSADRADNPVMPARTGASPSRALAAAHSSHAGPSAVPFSMQFHRQPHGRIQPSEPPESPRSLPADAMKSKRFHGYGCISFLHPGLTFNRARATAPGI